MSIESVLLVDDDRNIRRIAEIALNHVGGLKVFTASCGKEALAKAKDSHPDVILLDIVMPDQDGPETLKQLRRQTETQSIPVIFLTASATDDVRDSWEELGAAGVILKPFDPMSLSTQIIAILEKTETRAPETPS